MASPAEQAESGNVGLIIVQCLPKYRSLYKSWIGSRFHCLDPSEPSFNDPSAQALARSGRILLCVGLFPLDSATLDRFPSLQCVVATSVGLDHIDLSACRRRGIKVTNAGDAFSDDAADYAVGLLIDVLRRVSESHRYVRAGSWPTKGEHPLGSKLGGKRVEIVGLGRIGSKVAKRLEAFGCSIAYTSRKKKPQVSFPYYQTAKELAANSDCLILCCDLTSETRHMIDEEVMSELGKEGVIVNVGRGGLVNEKTLVKFLMNGQIGGAGIDVYENEPGVPKELFGLDNVVLSPHVAVETCEAIEALEEVVIGNLEAFFAGKPLISQVQL